jgi:signal transduction histidine kinase
MQGERRKNPALHLLSDAPILVVVLIALAWISSFNYLLFHSLTEMAIAAVALTAFAVAWNSRQFEHGFLLFVGFLSGYEALFGFLHALAYRGMNVFTNAPADAGTQLWIGGRLILAVSLLFAPYFVGRRVPVGILNLALLTASTVVLTLIFTGNFPICFSPETGLTPFKIYSEYFICALLAGSAFRIYRQRARFPVYARRFLGAYYLFGFLAEIIFTWYASLFDWWNRLGHIFLLISSYAFYKAIVETGIRRPFDVLFRELTEAVRTRDEFLSVASHELKTPLTPLKLQIQSFQRLLLSNRLGAITPEQAQKMVDVSTRQINRLTHLIESLLDVSRITSGKLQLNPEAVDIGALFEEILLRHGEEVKNTRTTVSTDLPAQAVSVQADHIRLDQVITNLFTNALKYAAGSQVILGARKEEDGSTLLWIQDSGPGVPKNFQAKIFERFERAMPGTHISGLGLGLFISRQIVDAHGGTLKVMSDPAVGGSRFEVRLPPVPQPKPVLERIKQAELGAGSPPQA